MRIVLKTEARLKKSQTFGSDFKYITKREETWLSGVGAERSREVLCKSDLAKAPENGRRQSQSERVRKENRLSDPAKNVPEIGR